MKYPREEEPAVIEKWLKTLYDYSNSCIGSDDACVGYLSHVVHYIAEKNCYSDFDLLKQIFAYLSKNSRVGKKYIKPGMEWVLFVGRGGDEEDAFHALSKILYVWLEKIYKAYILTRSKNGDELKELVRYTCDIAAPHAVKLCSKISYRGCTERWADRSSARIYTKAHVCKLNIGLSGIAEAMGRGVFFEYPTVGPRVYASNMVHVGNGRATVHVLSKDLPLIAFFAVAHEFAHCIAEICNDKRYTNAGNRKVHDEVFVQAYRQMLLSLSADLPELKKYISLPPRKI